MPERVTPQQLLQGKVTSSGRASTPPPSTHEMVRSCLQLCQRGLSHLPCMLGWLRAPHSWRVVNGLWGKAAGPGP